MRSSPPLARCSWEGPRPNWRLHAGVFGLLLLAVPASALGQVPERFRAVNEIRVGDIDGPLALRRVAWLVAAEGQVFLSQSRDQLVRVLSDDGDLIGEWGGSGEGPGEFRRLDWMGLVDGGLQVVDYGLGRITTFDLDGTAQNVRRIPRVRPPPPPPLIYAFPVYAATGEATIIFGDHPVSSGVPVIHAPGVLVDQEGSILDSVMPLRIGDRTVRLRRGGQTMLLSRPLHSGARHAMSVDGSTLVTADDERGTGLVLYRYHVGRRAQDTIETGLQPVPVPPSVADSIRAAMFERLTGRSSTVPEAMQQYLAGFRDRELERALELPRRVPAADALFVTADGEIWLREPNFGSGPDLWRIVSARGEILGEVEVPRGIELKARDGDRLWGISHDELFVQYVHRLRLERVGGSSGERSRRQ